MRKIPKVRDGFAGQRMHFGSRASIFKLQSHPLAAGFHVLHVGWFPRAMHHFVERPRGLKESILICCMSGSGWCEIGGGTRTAVRAGQALYVAGGTPHSYGASTREPWSIFWAHVGGPVAASYDVLLPSASHPLPMPAAGMRQIEEIFNGCLDRLDRGAEFPSLLYASHALRHAFGILFLADLADIPPDIRENCRTVSRSMELMRSHLDGRLSLGELAARAGLSPSRYSAVFSAAMGISPVEYHITLRMRAAAHLLDTTDLSIKETAAQLGYEDPYFFSRTFKKITGVSPRAYRRAEKG